MCNQPHCGTKAEMTEELIQQVIDANHRDQTLVTEEEIRANPWNFCTMYCEDDEQTPRSHWNFRVVTRIDQWTNMPQTTIMRVEYADWRVVGYDNQPTMLVSDTQEHLREGLERLMLSCSKPSIEWEALKKAADDDLIRRGPTCDHDECWAKSGREKPKKEPSTWTA